MIKQSELHRVKTTFGLPDYFKESEAEATIRTPMQAYADPQNRRYPCHTKSACYWSNAQFWENALTDSNSSEKVGQALLANAQFWGIENDVRQNIFTKLANQTVVDSLNDLPDSNFAIVQNTDNGPVRLYPMLDEETTKMAAFQLYEDRNKLPYAWRVQGAKNIMTKVSEQNIDFDNENVIDYLAKAAGKGISTVNDLQSALIKRANLLVGIKQLTVSKQLTKLAGVIGSQKLSKELCEKTAEVLDGLDTSTGLTRWYGDQINTPEEECHNILYKDVTDYMSKFVKTASGAVYAKEDLKNGVLEDAAREVGTLRWNQEFNFEKQCQVLEQADVDTAIAFERQFEANQIHEVKLDFDMSVFA